jgi:hypothetical protein
MIGWRKEEELLAMAEYQASGAGQEALAMVEYQAPEGGREALMMMVAMFPCPGLCFCCAYPLKTIPALKMILPILPCAGGE